jgi:hypothetical protein
MKVRLPQSPSARWLLGIALAVAAVAVASVVLVLVRQPERSLLPEDTPEGVVQRYVLAIQRQDFREAYSYLNDNLQEACAYSYFSDSTRYWLSNNVSVELGDTERLDGRAIVEIRITNEDTSPFAGRTGYSYTEQFVLTEVDGAWRFSEPPPPSGYCPGLERKTPIPGPTPAGTY